MTLSGYDVIGGPRGNVAKLHAQVPAPQVVFPYADGIYAWTEADKALFPRALHRYISVMGEADVQIDDYERGALSPAEAPGRIRAWNAQHPDDPKVVYCSRDTLRQIQPACFGLEYRVWLATLDGDLGAATGMQFWSGAHVVAVQWKNTPDYYDQSVIFDASWPVPW